MQNIDMNGHFNISIFNDQSYLKNQKNEVEFIHLNKNSNHTNIIDFQKKFPDIYDGKCLSINDETFGSTNFKLCDKTVIQNQVGNNAILFGTFEI